MNNWSVSPEVVASNLSTWGNDPMLRGAFHDIVRDYTPADIREMHAAMRRYNGDVALQFELFLKEFNLWSNQNG